MKTFRITCFKELTCIYEVTADSKEIAEQMVEGNLVFVDDLLQEECTDILIHEIIEI